MKDIDLTKSSVKTVSLNDDQLYVINKSINIVNLGYLIQTTGKNINIWGI